MRAMKFVWNANLWFVNAVIEQDSSKHVVGFILCKCGIDLL